MIIIQATYTSFHCLVHSFYEGWARFEPSEWAPGIWAGTEGLLVFLDDVHYKVVEVDLEDRKIKLEAV